MKKTVFAVIYVALICILILISHNLAYKSYPEKTAKEGIEKFSDTTTKETTIITEPVTEPTTIGIYVETTTGKKHTRGTMGMYNTASDDFVFADDYIFQKLKKAYAETDFSAKVKKGDLKLYDFYRSKFYKLVNNEVPFFDAFGVDYNSKNTYMYLSDLSDADSFGPNTSFKFFDFDGDTTPELYFRVGGSHFYIFKYIKEEDKFIACYDGYGWTDIYGTQKVATTHYGTGGDYTYCILDNDSRPIKLVYFSYVPLRENVTVFMAAFPVFSPTYNAETNSYDIDQKKTLDIEMQKQGYDQEYNGLIFFRITEEQYDELTKEFFQGLEDSRKALAEVEYTYDELFGEFEDFE